MKKTLFAILALVALCGVAHAQRHIEYRWRGFYVVGDASYGINLNRQIDEFDTIPCELNAMMPGVSLGFQFSKEAGVGLGFNYVADPSGAYTQMPLYAELRSHFLRSQLTPYMVLQVGYCLPLGASSEPNPVGTEIKEGGLYFGLEAGVRYAISRNLAVAGHVGYRLLQANEVLRTDLLDRPILNPPVNLHVLSFGASFYFSN